MNDHIDHRTLIAGAAMVAPAVRKRHVDLTGAYAIQHAEHNLGSRWQACMFTIVRTGVEHINGATRT